MPLILAIFRKKLAEWLSTKRAGSSKWERVAPLSQPSSNFLHLGGENGGLRLRPEGIRCKLLKT